MQGLEEKGGLLIINRKAESNRKISNLYILSEIYPCSGTFMEESLKEFKQYKGKTVKMRFSSLCENEHICNKCAGDLYYILDTPNIGTATPQLASAVKNVMMKSFHDSTEKFMVMDAMEAFGE